MQQNIIMFVVHFEFELSEILPKRATRASSQSFFTLSNTVHTLPSSKMAAQTTILQDGSTDYHPSRWQHGLPSSKMEAQVLV